MTNIEKKTIQAHDVPTCNTTDSLEESATAGDESGSGDEGSPGSQPSPAKKKKERRQVCFFNIL
jgi:hypothetical protein